MGSETTQGDRSERLDAAVAEYLAAIDAGVPLEVAPWLASHADIAGELAAVLDDLGHVGPLMAQPRAGGAETGEFDPAGAATAGATEARGSATDAHGGDPREVATGPPIRSMGDFELIGVLGRGGMGVVYEARQVSLGRLVALKMIKDDHLASEDDRRRFRREAEAIARLDHPNLLTILEVGEHEGHLYFTMPLIRGGSMADHLGRFRDDPRLAAGAMVAVAGAVHHAHQRAILHRDLKPANILLGEDGRPYVADFGLAKRLDEGEASTSGAILGTPAYMSPEQAAGRGADLTTASDVYGLGAILYTMMTGRRPFEGGSLSEILRRVAEGIPERPSRFNPGVDRGLEAVCLKCLAKEPGRRYSSAEAIADDLAGWLEGRPIAARPVGRLARSWLWCRRKPALAAMSAATIALALTTFFAILVGYAQTRARLRDSLLSQARADRQSPDSGRSWAAARALEDAAKIRPGADLREEYLRVLDLPDFRFESLTPNPRFAINYAPALTAILDGRRALVIKLGGAAEEMTLDGGVSPRSLPFLGECGPAARLSPDGKTLAITRRDLAATEVWDLASRARLGILKDAEGRPVIARRLAIAAESARIAAYAIREGQPFLATFDPGTFAADWSVPLHREVTDSLNFLPGEGGLVLTLTTDSGDVARSKQWVEIHRPRRPGAIRLPLASNAVNVPMSHNPHRVDFHSDARGVRMAAAGASGSVKVWDLGPLLAGTGEPREALSFRAGRADLSMVQYSPGGAELAAFDMDGTLRLFDGETGDLLVSGPFAPPGEVPMLPARPQWVDRERIVGESPRGLLAFRVRRPLSKPFRLARRDADVAPPVPTGPQVAPSGRWLACGLGAEAVDLIDLRSPDTPPARLEAKGVGSTAGFGPGSDRITVASRESLRTYDTANGRLVGEVPAHPGCAWPWALAVDGRGHVLVGGNDIAGREHFGPRFQVWDAAAGRSLLDLTLLREVSDPRDLKTTLSFSPDAYYPKLCFSPNVTHAALREYARPDGRPSLVRLFDLTRGTKVDEWLLAGRGPVALSDDARIVAVGDGPSVRLVRRDEHSTSVTLKTSEFEVGGLAVDPAGRWLASFAPREGVIRLWDVAREENVATFHIGRAFIGDVAIGPGGRWLVASDGEGRLRAWDLDAVGHALSGAGLGW